MSPRADAAHEEVIAGGWVYETESTGGAGDCEAITESWTKEEDAGWDFSQDGRISFGVTNASQPPVLGRPRPRDGVPPLFPA